MHTGAKILASLAALAVCVVAPSCTPYKDTDSSLSTSSGAPQAQSAAGSQGATAGGSAQKPNVAVPSAGMLARSMPRAGASGAVERQTNAVPNAGAPSAGMGMSAVAGASAGVMAAAPGAAGSGAGAMAGMMAAGAAGSGDTAGAGNVDPTAMPAMRSAGCGLTTSQRAGSWNTSPVSSGQGNRNYDIRLPPAYDPMLAYSAILLLHGCGNPTNNVPMEQVAGDAAIVVRGSGSKNGCWQETASGADVPYLDAIMKDVQDHFCVATNQWFAVGYSSGSWLANTLSCHRGSAFRGIATVTGGEPGEINDCKGQHGRIYLHDSTDNNNKIESDIPSRTRMLKTNHCGMETKPFDPSPCVEYQGCDPGYPVVWCQTSGQGHNRQDNLARPAFWNFFKQLIGK